MPRTRKAKTPADIRQQLLDLLGDVDRPGDICTSGDRPLTMPGLEVDGLGPLALPLTDAQAPRLIKLCRQAPYGKGTETVVDTDVRRVWELDPERFRFTNPKWDECVAEMVADVQKALGLTGRKLAAHIYKLLVYEKGSFFLPHRDGEKLDRMVATLVIGLPVVHKGGELIVSHEGRRHTITFRGAASGHELSYAAFYADCQHEVRPVRSGYRLCLTYNLTLAKSRSKKGIAAPSYGSTVAAIEKVLSTWRHGLEKETDAAREAAEKADLTATSDPTSTPSPVEKLAVTLEHRYTQDGLTIDKLKGIDRARAEVLFAAAEQADCVAHLALVTLWQSGSAEGAYDDYSYRYGRRGGYHWSDDEENEHTSRYEMGEIYDWSLSADHWSDGEGKNVHLGEIRLSEDEIVADEPLTEDEPNREDFEGYTGNAGMTLERWYHRAAVVIWPQTRHFHVLCGAGTNAAIGGLEAMVQQLKRAAKTKREEQRRKCLAFAAAIIDSWQRRLHGYSWRERQLDRSVFTASLCALNDPDLVRRFLSQVMPTDASVQLDKSFGKFAKQHGWSGFEKELTAVFDATNSETLARNAGLLRVLCVLRDKNTQRIELCKRLCERMVRAVENFDNDPDEHNWRVWEADRGSLLQSLVKAMLAVGAEKPLGELIDHALACDKYDLTDAHLAAMFALEKYLAGRSSCSDAILKWLSRCRQELERRTAEAPQEPTDYRRTANLSCRCGDCRALAKFLDDPNKREARFPLAKERRRHLHYAIDSNRLDCTHETERRGRPYTLVCTKTTASYQADCEVYQRDLKNLERIVQLEKKLA